MLYSNWQFYWKLSSQFKYFHNKKLTYNILRLKRPGVSSLTRSFVQTKKNTFLKSGVPSWWVVSLRLRLSCFYDLVNTRPRSCTSCQPLPLILRAHSEFFVLYILSTFLFDLKPSNWAMNLLHPFFGSACSCGDVYLCLMFMFCRSVISVTQSRPAFYLPLMTSSYNLLLNLSLWLQ